MNTRLEDANARFKTLAWMIGVGLVVLASLATLFVLLASVEPRRLHERI